MKYKVGDKVRIATDKSKSFAWNDEGKMDKWLGKVMTIRECRNFENYTAYKMKEDIEEHVLGWNWHETMIDGLVTNEEPKHSITITSDGKITTAIFTVDGKEVKKGIAKCSPEDKFNFKIGAELALERMWGKEEQKEKHWYYSKKKMLSYPYMKKIHEMVNAKWPDFYDGKPVDEDSFDKDGHGYINGLRVNKDWCEYR